MEEKKNGEIKALPSSEEAEQALLGCMIEGEDREHEIGMAWIREEDAFYYPDNRLIWKAIKSLYKNNVKIDFITLNDKVKEYKGESMAYYITGLTEAKASVANIENYARIVWRNIYREKLLNQLSHY